MSKASYYLGLDGSWRQAVSRDLGRLLKSLDTCLARLFTMASLCSSAHSVSTQSLVVRLDKGLRGGSDHHLADFDIGTFPRIAPLNREIQSLLLVEISTFTNEFIGQTIAILLLSPCGISQT